MRKEFIIRMTLDERKQMEQKCQETQELLVGIAKSIEDSQERAEFWTKIRNFNAVSDVFSD